MAAREMNGSRQARQAPAGGRPHTFQLTGGALCLDFANTVGDRPFLDEEHLGSYADLLSFARQAGLISAREAGALVRRSASSERAARAAFERAVGLRETIYRLFGSLARTGKTPREAIDRLNVWLADVMPRLTTKAMPRGAAWTWREDPGSLEPMLWAIVRSAAELITSGEAALVRECASGRCSWLFVDRSRTHRRRWCDMKGCGNREKARRHYERMRARL